MAIITWAIHDYTPIKSIGLCHSVQGTAATLAKYIGAPFEEVSYWVAGINHMSWFLELKWRGKDAYPLLREKLKDPAVYFHGCAMGWAGYRPRGGLQGFWLLRHGIEHNHGRICSVFPQTESSGIV